MVEATKSPQGCTHRHESASPPRLLKRSHSDAGLVGECAGEQHEAPRTRLWFAHLWYSWGLVEAELLSLHSGDTSSTKVHTEHIHGVCCSTLSAVAILVVIYWLQGVILPIMLAAGLAVLLEPFVFFFVDLFVRCTTPRRHQPSMRGVLDETGRISVELFPTRVPGTHGTDLRPAPGNYLIGTEAAAWNILRRLWCVLSVTIVLMSALSALSSVGIWVVTSVEAVQWKKYLNGPRVEMLRERLQHFGVGDINAAVTQGISAVIKAVGLQAIGSTYTIVIGVLLMVLSLGFFLVDSAVERSVGKEPWRSRERWLMSQVLRQSRDSQYVLTVEDRSMGLSRTLLGKMRLQMRAYITAKFYLSLFKAIIIGGAFGVLKVDLWLLWAVLTFVLNFMPMGSSISTLAPLPFVALDPQQGFVVLLFCLAWPLIVHNVVGNVVEPRIFANSLNLHPITVLMALTFWSSLWGILGAIVCVPLTAMVRVMLLESGNHPYTVPLLRLLEGRAGSAPRRPGPRVSERPGSTRPCRNGAVASNDHGVGLDAG